MLLDDALAQALVLFLWFTGEALVEKLRVDRKRMKLRHRVLTPTLLPCLSSHAGLVPRSDRSVTTRAQAPHITRQHEDVMYVIDNENGIAKLEDFTDKD